METPTKEQRDELRRKWVAALRSGEYRQGRGTMHWRGSHCCLGVAEMVAGFDEDFDYDRVFELYGLRKEQDGGVISTPLVTMNDDDKKSFPEIADFIEQHPDEVFVDAPAPVAARQLEGESQ